MVVGCWRSADAVFDQLEGAWSLARSIENTATMTGIATFTRLGVDALAYREDGTAELASGQSLKAYRTFRFERAPEGFIVLFDETPPRLFHRIELTRQGDELVAATSHICAPDSYESRYRFLRGGSFVIRHDMRGPRKDYVSVTTFTRL